MYLKSITELAQLLEGFENQAQEMMNINVIPPFHCLKSLVRSLCRHSCHHFLSYSYWFYFLCTILILFSFSPQLYVSGAPELEPKAKITCTNCPNCQREGKRKISLTSISLANGRVLHTFCTEYNASQLRTEMEVGCWTNKQRQRSTAFLKQLGFLELFKTEFCIFTKSRI